VWVGNWSNHRIYRLDASADPAPLRWWQLPEAARPQGLALDGDGCLWWADPGLHALARLSPASNQVVTCTLPAGAAPQMLALSGDSLWYTENISGGGRV